MAKPRVKVPKSAAVGDEITIKTLISHKMESGRRKDGDGNLIPRMIINNFTATFNGEEVVSVELAAAISTNPFVQFKMIMPGAGDLHFKWVDDEGSVFETTKSIAAA